MPTVVLHIHMIGPHISSHVDGQVSRPRSSLVVTLHRGLYHAVQSDLSPPDIVVGKCLMLLSLLVLFASFCLVLTQTFLCVLIF